MEEGEEEHGLIAVMLGSSVVRCEVPFRSRTKTFQLFNKTAISVDIEEGIGILDPETFLTPMYNEDDTEYEEYFDVNDDKISGDVCAEIAASALEICSHLNRATGFLYGSTVSHLEISFGVLSGEIYLINVLSCKLRKQKLYSVVQTVPDGVDILAEYLALCLAYETPESKCCGIPSCSKDSSIQVTLSVVVRYQLSLLFFDCDVDYLTNFIKCTIQELSPIMLRKTIRFCAECYKKWQIDEMHFVRVSRSPKQTKVIIKTKEKSKLITAAGSSIVHKLKHRKSVPSVDPFPHQSMVQPPLRKSRSRPGSVQFESYLKPKI